MLGKTTPVEELEPYQAVPQPVLDCVPNLDGQLTVDELSVATGVAVRYRFK
ncbi:MAG: hypothetical protein R3E66_10925 [bacterium]